MLRKALLFMSAVAVSFGLTAFSGYVVYANFSGRSEGNLSLVVRFAISPIIAILVGGLVGLFSEDRPVLVALLGLMPWTIMFVAGPHKPTSSAAWALWISPLVMYLALAATAAWAASRYGRGRSRQSSQLA